jgi:initiation factor 1A
MPKNTKGGKKAKSMKNSSVPTKAREIPVPEQEDDSHVAVITRVFGDGRYLCQIINDTGVVTGDYQINLSSGVKRKYARGIIMNAGTYVLMSLRDFQKDKGDIIFVYKDSELEYLKQNNYISISKDNVETDIDFSKDDDNNNNDPGFDFSEI